MLFDRDIILFDKEAATNKEALSILADSLREAGCVSDAFKSAILERESNFPTALQTETIGVAIPHTDADKVIIPQIGFMRLKHSVKFLQMGDNSDVQVKLIFMLALKKSDDQLKMLQTLMGLFQDKDTLTRLETVTDKNEFIKIMTQTGIIE
jgi:PTS system galactitol-specific IIA component